MSSNRARGAFTLVEVLVATVILGLVVTASLRLITLSMRNLRQIDQERQLMSRSRELELEILSGKKADNGEDKHISWRIMKNSHSVMGGLWKVNYRRLEITSKEGRKLTLYIP